MTHLRMDSTNGEVRVQLEIESDGAVETDFNSHLFKDALVSLIEEAPVDFWIKDEDELKPEEFWASILGAVARSYRAAQDTPFDDDVTNAAVLREIVDCLEGLDYL